MTAKLVGYAYDADVHCVECTEELFGEIEPRAVDWYGRWIEVAVRDDERLRAADSDPVIVRDSEENPLSPYYDSERSDSPQHCGDCHKFLGASLTSDGVDYVIETLWDELSPFENDNGRDRSVTLEWARYLDDRSERYDLDNYRKVIVRAFLAVYGDEDSDREWVY
jgi:hypothetical protein